jgi:hypothetical protein
MDQKSNFNPIPERCTLADAYRVLKKTPYPQTPRLAIRIFYYTHDCGIAKHPQPEADKGILFLESFSLLCFRTISSRTNLLHASRVFLSTGRGARGEVCGWHCKLSPSQNIRLE